MSPLRYRHHAPALPAAVLVALTLAFACLTIGRGIGWVTGERQRTIATVVMDALLEPAWWGLGLVVGGTALLLAYASRRHLLVYAAHGHLAALYVCITIMITQATTTYGGGWQHVVAPLGGAIWHSLLAWLTGPIPPRGEVDAERD